MSDQQLFDITAAELKKREELTLFEFWLLLAKYKKLDLPTFKLNLLAASQSETFFYL